jgi:hypothetical protein
MTEKLQQAPEELEAQIRTLWDRCNQDHPPTMVNGQFLANAEREIAAFIRQREDNRDRELRDLAGSWRAHVKAVTVVGGLLAGARPKRASGILQCAEELEFTLNRLKGVR